MLQVNKGLISTKMRKIWILIFISSSLFAADQSQVPPKLFSKDDVIRLLRGDVSPKRIEVLVREHGINFEINQEAEKELRQAGATDGLLVTLKELTPTLTTPTLAPSRPSVLVPTPKASPTSPPSPALEVVSTPGGAKVYIDDAPVGTTSREGHLKLPNLPVGKHRVRVSLDAYEDCELDIELTDSLPSNMFVVLGAKGVNFSGACLAGSSLVARTGKELETMKLRSGRNFFEFTLQKSKTPQRVGPIQLLLNKASPQDQRYTMTVFVDDRTIEKKDKLAGQPVQFYGQGSSLPYDIVVFNVGKNQVTGYVATPK
jgi:hypothetical protein